MVRKFYPKFLWSESYILWMFTALKCRWSENYRIDLSTTMKNCCCALNDTLINLQQRTNARHQTRWRVTKLIYYATHSMHIMHIIYYVFTSTFANQVALWMRLHTVALCYDIASLPNSNINLVRQQPNMM